MPSLATALLSIAALIAASPPAPASRAASSVRIFVVAGQSNAVGAAAAAADMPPAWHATQPDVRLWFEIGPRESVSNAALRVTSGSAFVPLRYQSDPTGRTFGRAIDGFGPEIRLGRALADSTDDDVAIVKFAFNATDMANHWNPDAAVGLCTQLIQRVQAARAAIASAGQASTLEGIFWMQGEADAANSDDAWKYAERLMKLIARVRAELRHPTLPFVIGRLNAGIDTGAGVSLPYLNVIRAQQAFVVANVPHTVLVDTDDLALAGDFLHFPAASELALGLRFAAEALSLTRRAPGTPFCFASPACPCGNASSSAVQSGCTNSFARAGKLLSSGTARLSDDDLQLSLVGLPNEASALFVEHDARHNGGFGTPMGDGLRCLDGHAVRLGRRVGNAVYPEAGESAIHTLGMALPGRTLYYQVIYRDDVSFCTPSSYNSTNALAISWSP